MKVVKLAADIFAKVAETAAKEAAGSASWDDFYQPEEPENIMSEE